MKVIFIVYIVDHLFSVYPEAKPYDRIRDALTTLLSPVRLQNLLENCYLFTFDKKNSFVSRSGFWIEDKKEISQCLKQQTY